MRKGKKSAESPQSLSPRITLQNGAEVGQASIGQVHVSLASSLTRAQHILVPQLDRLPVADDLGIVPVDKFWPRLIAEDIHAIQLGEQTSIAGSASASRSRSKDDIFEVISTPDRGLAIFSTRKIKAGTLVLAERPLISLDKHEENDFSAIEREFSKLSRAEQKIYLRLFDAQKSRMSLVVSIYYSNCYNCEGFRPNGQGGSAIGALSSRVNHSCVPNLQFSYDEGSNEMRFYTIRDISRGKEMCSNYDKSVFEVTIRRQRKQQMYYGFVCRCEACEPKTEYWAKSDERRMGMYDAVRAVQRCEKKWSTEGDAVMVEKGHGGRFELVEEALSSLARLEGLLLKESLVGVPLANTYRSMAKWAERKGDKAGDEAIRWKIKELGACITAFGEDGQRTKDIEAKLEA